MTTLPAAVIAAAVSDTGRVREHNEDAVWLGDTFFRDQLRSASFTGDAVAGLLLGVADGVGGAAAGEVASEWVASRMAERIHEVDMEAPGTPVAQELSQLARGVNEELIAESERRPGRQGMATTYTALLFTSGVSYWVNAGDSRLYGYSEDTLRQLNRDHTLREERGDPSIPGNIITNCYGTPEGFYLDVGTVAPDGADLFLLCSDGLSDYADMDRAEAVLRRTLRDIGTADTAAVASRLEDAVGELLQLALSGGGGDNVTAVIVRPVYA